MNFIEQWRKISAYKAFIILIILIFNAIIVFGTFHILNNPSEGSQEHIFKAIGFIIIMLWFCVFLWKTNNNRNIIEKSKQVNASKAFILLVIIIFSVITIFGVLYILDDSSGNPSAPIFKAIGFVILMLWFCIFLCYFIWAIYYYNLNLGKTNKEWKVINEAKQSRANGAPYAQENLDEEPLYNPYKDETFGVPPGTVRGMIAFTLLFGAIALLIVSFGMENTEGDKTFIIQQFDFFKQAFLMMVAFYFGSKSLKYLKSNPEPQQPSDNNSNKNATDSNLTSKAPKTEIVVIKNDASDNTNQSLPNGTVAPIQPIDPMSKKK